MTSASNTDPHDRPALPGERVEWSMAEWADTFGMSTELALDRLRACSAAVKRGGRYYTNVAKIRHAFEDHWPEIVARLRARDAERARRKANRPRPGKSG